MGNVICGIVEVLFGTFVLIGLSKGLAEAGIGDGRDLAKRVLALCLGAFILGTGIYHLINGLRTIRATSDEKQT
jgi:hypothetical protein